MEICLKFLPRKSYDKNGLFLLMIFVSIGVVLIGIAGIFEAQATLECNPDKNLASSTRKYIARNVSSNTRKNFTLRYLFMLWS